MKLAGTTRSRNAEYLRELRQRAALEGKCYTCRARPHKPGIRTCQACIDRSAKLTRSVRYERCINCYCNLPARWSTLLCPGCRDSHNTKERAYSSTAMACWPTSSARSSR